MFCRSSARAVALLLLLVPGSLWADNKTTQKTGANQDVIAEDTIFLKNGTYLSGTIVEENAVKGVTIKTEDGQLKTVKNSEIKKIDRATAQPSSAKPKEPEKKESKAATPPAKEPPKDSDSKAKTAASSDSWVHPSGASPGVSLDIGASKAKSFGFFVGAHANVDIGLSDSVYARLEPGLWTFSRSTHVTAPSRIDVPASGDPVVTSDTITNDVRTWLFGSRLLIGFDYAQTSSVSLTGRVGGLLAFSTSKTSAAQCESESNGKITRSGLAYGGSISPITARLGSSRGFELGSFIDILSVSVPKCDFPVPDQSTVQIPVGGTAFFPAYTVGHRVMAVTFGLSAGFMFW